MTIYLRTGLLVLLGVPLVLALALPVRFPNGMPYVSSGQSARVSSPGPKAWVGPTVFQAVVEKQLQRLRAPDGRVVRVLGAVTHGRPDGSSGCRALLTPSVGDVACADVLQWEVVP